jgi:hypothetical protein
MAKKAEKADPKKECPSCGLGVNPESSVCEFCGWDFEEEDEWILQIEKLERDLMLEKQKFEPGTVNHMIEATLRTPVLEQLERSVPADEGAIEEDEGKVEEAPQRRPSAAQPAVPERKVAAEVPVRKVKEPPVQASSSVPQRRVRTVASSPPPARPAQEEEEQPPMRKARTLRKVKR